MNLKGYIFPPTGFTEQTELVQGMEDNEVKEKLKRKISVVRA